MVGRLTGKFFVWVVCGSVRSEGGDGAGEAAGETSCPVTV